MDHFPYADAVNHLARYRLIADYLAGHSTIPMEFRFLPTGYIAGDLLGVGLLHLFPAGFAARLLALLALLIPSIGVYVLAGSLLEENRDVVGVLPVLSLNWYLFYGFFNYLIGLGFAYFFLAWWWKLRDVNRPSTLAVTAVGIVVIGLWHLAAVAIALTVIWTHAIWSTWNKGRNRSGAPWTSMLPIWVIPLTAAMAGFSFAIVSRMLVEGSGSPVAESPEMMFRTPFEKAMQFLSPIYVFSLAQALLMVGTLSFAFVACWIEGRRSSRRGPLFLLTGAMLLFFFLVFPVEMGGVYDVDVRFLLPGYVFLLFWAAPRTRVSSWVLRLVTLGVVVHSAVTYTHMRTIDESLGDLAEVIDALPNGVNVVALVATESRGRVDPERHFIFWHTIQHGGLANTMFTAEHGGHLAHFMVSNLPYDVPLVWIPGVNDPDWHRVAEDYQYAVTIGARLSAGTQAQIGAEEILSRGQSTLYLIADPPLPR
ncbi:MAG: hypothetical protein WEG36_14800 [Gemmatimonadota bacterium]